MADAPRLIASDASRNPPGVRSSAALTGLFVLALGCTFYFAAGLLIPITISVLLSILFFPVVRNLARAGVPRALSSALIVTAVVLLVGLAISTLAGPAQEWLREAPQSLRQLKREMLHANENLEDIKALAKQVQDLTDVEDEVDPAALTGGGAGTGRVRTFLGNLPLLIGTAIVMMFLTFFMLVSGDTLLRKATRCGRTFTERRQIVTIARRFQSELSHYLATVTIINILLGCVTGLVLFVLEVPNPAMWGTMVGLFNFAPYLGAVVSTLVLTVVGLMNFPSFGEAMLVPGSFVVLTTLEGQLITPAIIGRNMSINPLMVLLSVIVWGWLWGIAGALMAVPLLASFRAVCEHWPPLRQVGEFLSNEPANGGADGKHAGPASRWKRRLESAPAITRHPRRDRLTFGMIVGIPTRRWKCR
jgi:predicted PurR-regulated permease PerM